MDWGLLAAKYSNDILGGVLGGAMFAVLAGLVVYLRGWRAAANHRGAHFHIAGTMYTPIDLSDPAHAAYRDAAEAGKTHVQELLWLGEETDLPAFIGNSYVCREVLAAMHRSKRAGLLLGQTSDNTERPLLKKILGYHNTIPTTDLVRLYKDRVGRAADGRVHGISPPTHEHYASSPHRRVLRAMFIADGQIRNGLPPKELVHFPQAAHAHRYDTLESLIAEYRANPTRFDRCRAYF